MANPMIFDAELIRRYDCNGPRYTSYPTAPHFRDDFDVAAYRNAALLSNDGTTPLSIYVHVPFCASPCFYCGCNRVITRDEREGVRYVEALRREIDMQATLFHQNRRVEQLHFGGGTPTFLALPQLEGILRHLRREFTFDPDRCEASIEIDPRTVSPASIAGLAGLGFNRISLGVQDFDHAVQQAVNRVQSVEETLRIVESARRHGIDAINFDLIYGLPKQTVASFARTLELVTEMRPTRIAAYGYAHMPANFKAQRQIDAADLPSPTTRLELLALTIEALTAAGYRYIGMDHFALPDDPLAIAQDRGELHRNFQGYSSQADCDLIGLGVSSIGKVGNAYAQNRKTLREYYARVENYQLAIARGLKLTSDDRVRRDVIQALMCHGVVDTLAIERDHCIDFREYFAPELARLAVMLNDGLLAEIGTRIVVSDKGRFLVRNVAMTFDAYLGRQQAPVYSKAI
jgi:oxygen-independent coproporphyrinogen III oxidase